VQRLTGVTVLHVTHSQREAAELADLLLVLEGGAVKQRNPSPPPPDERVRRSEPNIREEVP
jgi:ABC-type sulfate/molybdate transport systems ATPase subunit